MTPQNPQKTAHGHVSVIPLFVQQDGEPEMGGSLEAPGLGSLVHAGQKTVSDKGQGV